MPHSYKPHAASTEHLQEVLCTAGLTEGTVQRYEYC
nr:MAG TPA: hypothetical protein [Caudoviricetes sp.]